LKSSSGRYLSLAVLALSYSSVYIVVYMQYILYDPLLKAFGVNQAQLGFLMSAYAIGCMILYIPGGFIADKFSTRRILTLSLLCNGVVCLAIALSMNYAAALVGWFAFSVTSAFAFWAALVKGVLSLGTEGQSGRNYGLYAFGCGVLSTLLNGFAAWMFTWYANTVTAVRMVIIFGAIASFVSGVLVHILYRDPVNRAGETQSDRFRFSYVGVLLKSPILWMLSVCIFMVYGLRVAGATYFNTYLVNVKGVSVNQAEVLGLLRTYIFPLLAPLAGYISDKILRSTARMFIIGFAALAVLFFVLTVMPATASRMFVVVWSLIPGVISAMMYGIMFSVLKEAKIPGFLSGTAIGIVSIVGYLPDFAFGPIFGGLIVKFGNKGFTYIFSILVVLALVGIFTGWYIRFYRKGLDSGKFRLIGSDAAARKPAETKP
jgi:sugar phosphate permease